MLYEFNLSVIVVQCCNTIHDCHAVHSCNWYCKQFDSSSSFQFGCYIDWKFVWFLLMLQNFCSLDIVCTGMLCFQFLGIIVKWNSMEWVWILLRYVVAVITYINELYHWFHSSSSASWLTRLCLQ